MSLNESVSEWRKMKVRQMSKDSLLSLSSSGSNRRSSLLSEENSITEEDDDVRNLFGEKQSSEIDPSYTIMAKMLSQSRILSTEHKWLFSWKGGGWVKQQKSAIGGRKGEGALVECRLKRWGKDLEGGGGCKQI